MNSLAQKHFLTAPTGAPPGYVGSIEGHSLFDETAIAGSHTRPSTKTIDFRNCVIFITSNVAVQAAQQYLDKLNLLPQKIQQLYLKRMPTQQSIEKIMQRKFDLKFLNRIDRSLPYQAVSVDALPQLVEIELENKPPRSINSAKFNSLQQLKPIFMRGYDIYYGARHLRRNIRTKLESILALYFLSHPEKSEMCLDCSADQLNLTIK